MSRQSTSQAASARPHRIPLAGRQRLALRNQEAGYKYRIVNDVEDRVERFTEAGYELVPANEAGLAGDRRVDSSTALGSSSSVSVGKGTRAVVMRIREEWYQEDQQTKQADIDSVEQTMKQNANKASDYGSFEYIKK